MVDWKEVFELKSAQAIILGMFIMLLAWTIWRVTGSLIGWLVLFLPAAWLIGKGVKLAFKGE
jgi:hypothetical protein